MRTSASTFVLKLFYGFCFVVIVPIFLLLWALETEPLVPLPSIRSPALGIGTDLGGLVLIVWGMLSLLVHGKGLPMNAFPPGVYVRQGIYRIIPHPIYTGFTMCCFGTAILAGSPSGFWLVAPIAALGSIALVEGFEKQDLIGRFGHQVRKCLISLPEDAERKPLLHERISVYLLVFIPWVLLYEIFVALGNPADAIVAYLPFERNLPVYEWTEIFYGATYLFVCLVPIVVTRSRTLREFSIAGLIATWMMVLMFIGIPLIAPPREFTAHGILGDILNFERGHDTSAAAFPSYHVVWAYIAARAFAETFPGIKILWWSLAALIAASCLTTGMHAVVDVLAGVGAGLIFMRYKKVWELVRYLSERIANSWREWQTGNVRIINHGVYTAAGAGAGVLIAGILLGPGSVGYLLVMAFCSLIMAGMWAQVIEGSPSLLRPYGYYGGVLGIVIGGILAGFFGGDIWLLLGSYGVAGPVIQGLGRLRCLVQGCCHGREAPPHVGIRYTHPRSRVVRLTKFSGIPLHPAPLYSLLWNIVIGVVLARLWILHAAPTLVAGLYLVLNGLGRFVEEAYRGEPQTPILGKLRLYQLMAILSVVGGAVLTMVRSDPTAPAPQFNYESLVAGVGFAIVIWFAQGVDFPDSNRRFSRLV